MSAGASLLRGKCSHFSGENRPGCFYLQLIRWNEVGKWGKWNNMFEKVKNNPIYFDF